MKGVAYGPFAPNEAGLPFASFERTARDFALIRELGANTVRVYAVPPKWVLELAREHQLKLLVDIPWTHHVCFLDRRELREQAIEAVRNAVRACAAHPAVFAFSVGNEIAPDIVRWSGAAAIARFIDELASEAHAIDPGCLCTYSNFPSTEFVRPQALDFVSFNVYLHHEPAARAYLARLQMTAGGRPLLLSEMGCDSIREGEERKCGMLRWQVGAASRGGLAGCVVFSFTDDWHRNGGPVLDWEMGVTTRDREPKPSYYALQTAFATAPHYPLPRTPRISVVVANYNGGRTLKACLESLGRVNYPDCEVILVDDGSTDGSAAIARAQPHARVIEHPQNLGLSTARNTGIAAATGEIVAFTDSDCRVDEDWLYYLAGDLLEGGFAGIGGHNLLPPDDSAVAAAVMASPGGPAHVMLTDRTAEHIPGCNMAFYRQTLLDLGGFDPVFRRAGDDVDICWRIAQAGGSIGFSHGGFVWHYRRSTVRDYFKQQYGYGEAEALLARKHPEYFNSLGGSMWRGRIYALGNSSVVLEPDVVYRGLFGSAGFQSLYQAAPSFPLALVTSLEYCALVVLPLAVLSVTLRALLPLAIASLAIPVILAGAAGAQAALPPWKQRWWSRPLVAALFLLQPVVRGWARYAGRFSAGFRVSGREPSLESIALRDSARDLDVVEYWSEGGADRLRWVEDIVKKLEAGGWPHRVDSGWGDHDVEVYGTWWCKLQLVSAVEYHAGGGRMLRMRLRGRWSLRATAGFWLLAGFELLLIGVLAPIQPWVWLLLLTLPAAGWFLNRDKRNLQSMMTVFLDELSLQSGLAKAGAGAAAPPAPPPAPPAANSPFARTAPQAQDSAAPGAP